MRGPATCRTIALGATAAALIVTLSPTAAHAAFSVTPDLETEPVTSWFDAADDPAIWVNPSDPSRSVVIGTDKQGALDVYDLGGARIQHITGVNPNNVDLRGDVVTTSDQYAGALRFYRMNPTTRTLSAAGSVQSDLYIEPGVCMYRSASSGTLYAFSANNLSGVVDQYRLTVATSGVSAAKVRSFDVGGAIEGCVADDTNGALYVGEEDVGIWRYGAEPGAGTTRTAVDSTGSSGHLTADVEGLAIAGDHLFASSQGNNSFVAYDRQTGAYVNTFQVAAGSTADDCDDTDGIEATVANLGPRFPHGLFICQDGSNGLPGSWFNQNFKFVSIDKVLDNLD